MFRQLDIPTPAAVAAGSRAAAFLTRGVCACPLPCGADGRRR